MRPMTEKALQEAFAAEAMAHVKYLMFQDRADKDGFPNLAKLFKATAYAELVHAMNHARNLGIVKGTKNNMDSSIEGETYALEETYPVFAAIAKLQGEKGAEKSIRYALAAERTHAKLYQEVKKKVSHREDPDVPEVYVCSVCGYTHGGSAPERCPVCNVLGDKFRKF
jgi:rubrerythrin